MKKLLLTIGLVAAGSLAYGQGTLALSNGTLYRLSSADALGVNLGALPTTQGAFTFQLFYGATAGSLTLLDTLSAVNSTTGAGLIASGADSRTALSLVAIPGFAPGAQPFIKIVALSTDNMWKGETPVIQTGALGPATGPAAALWQSATGTSVNRFKAADLLITPVPEPSTMALAGLAAASLLIFRRRQ